MPPDATDNTRRERALLQRFGVTRIIQVTLSRLPSQYPTVLQSTSQQQPKEEALYTHHVSQPVYQFEPIYFNLLGFGQSFFFHCDMIYR